VLEAKRVSRVPHRRIAYVRGFPTDAFAHRGAVAMAIWRAELADAHSSSVLLSLDLDGGNARRVLGHTRVIADKRPHFGHRGVQFDPQAVAERGGGQGLYIGDRGLGRHLSSPGRSLL